MCLFKALKITLAISCIMLLSACAYNVQYRTTYKECDTSYGNDPCHQNALEKFADPRRPENDYLLGLIEFDEQGKLYDRQQMYKVLDGLKEYAKSPSERSKNMVILTYIHGWMHNAEFDDSDVNHFRYTLKGISKLEYLAAKVQQRTPRKVAGIYIGWRGRSLEAPLIKYGTFWERKNTAQEVGYGGVTEILSRLEELRDALPKLINESEGKTRLVIIGHSFGGAVVYSALSEVFMQRFVATKESPEKCSNVNALKDLVILINPAFEAMCFATLSDMANDVSRYCKEQLPVLAILTSETDWATKYAFWAGRALSTVAESHITTERKNATTNISEEISEGSADRTAIGHFDPYQTHYLEYREGTVSDDFDYDALQKVKSGWDQDAPGKAIGFPGSLLKHLNNSISRNPYLVIKVDKRIIPDHGNFYDLRVTEFLRYLISLSIPPKKTNDANNKAESNDSSAYNSSPKK